MQQAYLRKFLLIVCQILRVHQDGSIATYQTLPWNMRGWHSGSGPKGNGNDTLLGFEICEDGLTNAAYFRSVFNEAVDLCMYLCAMYALIQSDCAKTPIALLNLHSKMAAF